MAEIEQRVLAALRQHLLSPDIVAMAVEAYRVEYNRLVCEQARTRARSERELIEINGKIARIINVIESSDRGRKEAHVLAERLAALEAQRLAIMARTAPISEREAVSIHPQAAVRYQQKIAEIHNALSRGDSASTDAINLVRELIAEIHIVPRGAGKLVALEIVGDLAALMTAEHVSNNVTASVVAGARFELATFRL